MTASLLAMTHAGYVAAGYLTAVGVFGGYALLVIRRGRKLSRIVPPEARRWS